MIFDINTTSVCNLGCLYCSEGKNPNMPDKSRILNSKTKVTIQDLDLLVNQVFEKDPKDDIVFAFWGGEPFLNFDFCKEVMYHFKDNNKISFLFYSNGSYIEKYLEDIKELNKVLGKKPSDGRSRLFIQISYDGRKINDIERLTKNGKSTSDVTLKAFNLLRENGIETKTKSTVTPKTFKYLFDAFKEHIEMKTNYFPTPDAFSDTDYDNEEYLKDLKINLMQIAKYIYDNKLEPETFRWFSKSKALCQAGIGYFSFDLDGEATPCHSTMYESFSDHHVGHIRDIDLFEKFSTATEKYKDLSSKIQENCKDCDCLFCIRCPAGNYNLPSNLEIMKTEKVDNEYIIRWTHKNNNMCKVFKIADTIHKTLRQLIQDRKDGTNAGNI